MSHHSFNKVIITLFLLIGFTVPSTAEESLTVTSGASNYNIQPNQTTVSVTFTITASNLIYAGLYELRYNVDGGTGTSIGIWNTTQRVENVTVNLPAGSHRLNAGLFDASYQIPMPLKAAYFDVTCTQILGLTAKNNFNAGTLYVENYTTPKNSGYSFAKPAGGTVALGAIDQQYDPYYRLWNSSGTNNSNWQRQGYNEQTPSPIAGATPRNYTYAVASSDNNATLIADMKKRFSVSRNDQTEFDGTIPAGVVTDIVEQNSGTIPAPSTKTVGSNAYNFMGWQNGGNGIFTPTDNQPYPNAAIYKTTHKTNSTSALTNTSQRKVVRTDEGYLFLVYESGNRVWLERSVDNGTTWSLCNNGPIDNGPEAKQPSLDYLTDVSYGGVNNELFITYQQKTSNGNYTIQIARCNNAGQKLSDQIIYSSSSSYSNNTTPTVSVTWYYRNEWRKQIVGIWKEPASSGVNAGLYWYGAYYIGSTFNWNSIMHFEQIANTTSSSVNPSIDIFKYDSDARLNALNFHFAWEQAGQSVNYWKVICGYSGLSLSGYASTPSYGDGWPYNYRPSVTAVANDAARLSWLGYYNDGADIFSTTVFADPSYSNHFWNFGSDVTSTNINKNYDLLYGLTGYSVGWTQFNGSGYSNYAVKGSTLSGPINLNASGKDMQLSNSWDYTDQRGITLTTSSPYAFQSSSPVQQSSGGGGKELGKSSSTQISAGRMGVVVSGNAQFHFTLGDISVNGKPVDFKELTDTSKVNSSDDYKSFLITKPFVLDGNSQFFYGVQYGVTDSITAVSVLGDNQTVHFKVELIDAATEQIIGVTDDVTYSSLNVTPYENIAYEVNTSGIGNKTVKLRLSVASSLSANYTLSDKRSQSSVLAKRGEQRLQKDFRGSLIVKEYALSQNYPNPFNPTTIINYALPKAGNVVLKVYDVLGKEVATLVNNYKESGRYSVEFDASKLSSGMYIYKLTSDKFSEVKKMILLR